MNEERSVNLKTPVEDLGKVGSSLFLGVLCERDVDLLIVESVYSDPELLRWFCNKTNIKETRRELLEARVSSFEASGESYIEFWVKVDSEKTIVILLENKIDANFQPHQADRYLERGKAYVSRDRCCEFRLGLVAPEST